MEAILITLVVIAVAANVVLAVALLRRKNEKPVNGQGEGLNLILQGVHELSRVVDQKVNDLAKTVDSKIHESSKSMQDSMTAQLSQSSKLIKEVTVGLTNLGETNKQVISFADQLQNLQDMLKNPKHRGILGEYYLEAMLKDVLAPAQYKMQYKFKNGDIVDAVVFIKNKIVPIDSKFSLENYNRLSEETNKAERENLEKVFLNDLKGRIKETAKYIRPEEGTLEFAFMFIPHEAIYYELLANKIGTSADETDNILARAFNQYKVLIVSSTSFFAYLQTVHQGLHALQIEENVKDVIKHVGELNMHLKKYGEYHNKLGISLGTVTNHYNASTKEFKKIDKDVSHITGEAPGIGADLLALEKPEVGE